MITRDVTVLNRAGLHTRPSATIVKKASQYRCEFYIDKDGMRINGKSIIGVMTLAAEQGSSLTLVFEGAEEEAAAADIVEYFQRGFDEEF